MVSAAILALIKAVQLPLTLLGSLNLSGPLYPPERNVANESCYDYIIIGGGTAGCAVAGRLSENPNNTVLLLEAGKNPPLSSFLPPFFPLFADSAYDRNYKSTFDSYAASSQNNFTKLSAGLGLGGTSFIDHFIINRGDPVDYDEWASISNDSTWEYKNVIKYFKKSERLVDKTILNSNYSTVHGLDGPNAITRQPKKYADKYLKALNETGSRTPLDITGEYTLGYAQSLLIVDSKGIRQNTAYTYLTPARLRPNLYVSRHTTVTRIIFEGKRAVAVVAIKKGKLYVYRACKEIILSAGVFNSPKILMLSGIGPREHLESLNITVKADLPVGKNFQDQVSISLVHRTEKSVKLPPVYTIIPTQVPFPLIAGLAALDPDQSFADYQLFLLFLFAYTPFLELTCAVVFQFRTDLCDEFKKANKFHNSLYGLLSITQPDSRGYVKLRSMEPADDPLITTGYFTNQTDLENIVDYVTDYLKIENSTYFKKINATLIDPNLKQCKNYTFRTRDYWKCYALNNAGSIYHNCGTCSMGSVVDGKLRVYGLENLRVVDASAMPTLTHASPYASVLMLAEKAADMIKSDADKQPSCRECAVPLKKKKAVQRIPPLVQNQLHRNRLLE